MFKRIALFLLSAGFSAACFSQVTAHDIGTNPRDKGHFMKVEHHHHHHHHRHHHM